MGKSNKKSKKKLVGFKIFIKTILILVIVVIILLSPLFNISKIVVTGNEHYKSQDLTDITNLEAGTNIFINLLKNNTNIFTLRYKNEEEYLKKQLHYIKNIKVSAKLPGTIIISIVERKPVGIIPYLGSKLLIDEDGVVIDIVSSDNNDLIPVIKGLEFDKYELGKMIRTEDPDKIGYAVKILNSILKSDKNDDYKILNLLDSIDVSNLNNIIIKIDNRINVNIGNLDELDYRIVFMKQIFKKNLKDSDKGLIDFTKGESPRFIPEN